MTRFPFKYRPSVAVICVANLTFCLPACSHQSASSPETQALVKKSLSDMVFVRGGTFMMGDFGPSVTPEKLPLTAQHEDKPVHKVALDSFSIGRYKVTYADFDVYMKAVGNLSYPDDRLSKKYRVASHPVGVPWKYAKDYCRWLGKQSGLPIDLPTEAQWEYAARSGGKQLVFATDDGKWEPDRNFPSEDTIADKLVPGLGMSQIYIYPVGKYPPNPIGLYDMGFDGKDWVNDWFDPGYYDHSPEKNPQGPPSGTKKVARGFEGGYDESAMTVYRDGEEPAVVGKGDLWGFPTMTFRCAIQSPNPQ